MKVTVVDTKTGKEKTMAPRFAKILTRMGRATYLTRDMIAVPVAPDALPPEEGEPISVVTEGSLLVSPEVAQPKKRGRPAGKGKSK